MTDSIEISLKVWVVINRAVRSISEHLRHQVEAHGISFTEFAVLEVLLHKGPLPIGEIGDQILLTSGSMTYVIDKLVKRALIGRRTCLEDRRVIYAELTMEGRTLIEKVFSEHAHLINELMNVLSPQEKETVIDLLKRLGLTAQHQRVKEQRASV